MIRKPSRATRRLVAAFVFVIASTACGVPIDDRTHTIASEDVPFELLDPTPTSTTSTTIFESGPTTTVLLEPVYLYLVRNERVERVRSRAPGRVVSTRGFRTPRCRPPPARVSRRYSSGCFVR